MDYGLRDRENALWAKFAETGVVPAVPTLGTSQEVELAHALLRDDYNQLLKLLYGEALAKAGVLNAQEKGAQAEAARWVWRMAISSKRNYQKKSQMVASLNGFRAASANRQVALVAGLEKGAQMLKDTSEAAKPAMAERFLSRLVAVSREQEGVSSTDEFIRLAISVGWVFAKKNDVAKLRQVFDLLPDELSDSFFCEQIGKLRDKLRFVDEEPIRVWYKDVKSAEESGSAPERWVLDLLKRSLPFVGCGRWYEPVWSEDAFDNRRVFLTKVTRMVGRFKEGMPTSCASAFLQILKKDGLKDLSGACFERRKKELKPGEQLPLGAKSGWPSLAEDIAKKIVAAGKSCFGKHPVSPQDAPDLEWAISFLEEVYGRFTDDEWGDYRLGKLLVWAGERERGIERVIPVVRKKQTEYWAWDLLGELMPEKRKCCVARALACKTEEIYTKHLKEEAASLGIEALSSEERARLAGDADDLLIAGLKPHRGIVIDRFKTKEDKRRIVFSSGDGTDIAPISPRVARLANVRLGMPVDLYWEHESSVDTWCPLGVTGKKGRSVRLIAVKPRIGEDWDVLKSERAVFLGSMKEASGSVAGIYADEHGMEFLSRAKADRFETGEIVEVRFRDVVKEGRSRECVFVSRPPECDEAERFGLLPSANVVYFGQSQKGTSYLFSSGRVEFSMRKDLFPANVEIRLGDSFRIRYSKRLCVDKTPLAERERSSAQSRFFQAMKKQEMREVQNIHLVERIDTVSDLTKRFVGRMRMPNGIDGPGYVDDVFISPELFLPLLTKENTGTLQLYVDGVAVKLPPKRKVDKYGIAHMESRSRAVSLQCVTDLNVVEQIEEDEARAQEEFEELREERESRR